MKSTYFLGAFLASCMSFFSIHLTLENSPSTQLEVKMKKAIAQVMEANDFKLVPIETSILSDAKASWETTKTFIYKIQIKEEVEAFAYLG